MKIPSRKKAHKAQNENKSKGEEKRVSDEHHFVPFVPFLALLLV